MEHFSGRGPLSPVYSGQKLNSFFNKKKKSYINLIAIYLTLKTLTSLHEGLVKILVVRGATGPILRAFDVKPNSSEILLVVKLGGVAPTEIHPLPTYT